MGSERYLGLIYIGAIEFRDQFIPVPGKDEWGVDTMLRELRGPASRYERLIETLSQGTKYKGFFLQTWQEIADPIFPGVRLLYKGFANDRKPKPAEVDDVAQQSVSIGAEDASGIVTMGSIGKVISATRDISYLAPQTTHRYIQEGKPESARYSKVNGGDPVMLSSRITVQAVKNDVERTVNLGSGSAPAALITALTPAIVNQVVSHSAAPIHGTPYFECVDVVQRIYQP